MLPRIANTSRTSVVQAQAAHPKRLTHSNVVSQRKGSIMSQSQSMPSIVGMQRMGPPANSKQLSGHLARNFGRASIAACLADPTPSSSSGRISVNVKRKRTTLASLPPPLPPHPSDGIANKQIKEGKGRRSLEPLQRVGLDASGLDANGSAHGVSAVVIKRLEDTDCNIRAAAVKALGKVAEKGNAEAVAALTNCLGDKDEDVRLAAEEVLTKVVENGIIGLSLDTVAQKLSEAQQQRQLRRTSEVTRSNKQSERVKSSARIKNTESDAPDTDSRLARMQAQEIPNCSDPLAETMKTLELPPAQHSSRDRHPSDDSIFKLDLQYTDRSIEDVESSSNESNSPKAEIMVETKLCADDFSVDELVQTLPDPDPNIGRLALEVAFKPKDEAESFHLQSAPPAVKIDILDVLIKIALQGAEQALEAIESWRVSDPDPSVRLKAGYALSQVTARTKKLAVKTQGAAAMERSRRASMVTSHAIETNDGEMLEMSLQQGRSHRRGTL